MGEFPKARAAEEVLGLDDWAREMTQGAILEKAEAEKNSCRTVDTMVRVRLEWGNFPFGRRDKAATTDGEEELEHEAVYLPAMRRQELEHTT